MVALFSKNRFAGTQNRFVRKGNYFFYVKISKKTEDRVKINISLFTLKKQHHTLCKFNLVLFLGSFVLLSLLAFFASTGNLPFNGLHTQILHKQEQVGPGSVQQISEETENDFENDFELATVLLPFTVSTLSDFIIHKPSRSLRFNSESDSKPIYLSIRNFRI